MTRKIMKSGNGYIFTLPVEWIRKFGLDKGDELHLDERGESLVLNHSNAKVTDAIKLKLNSNKNQIVNQIITSYIKGADEIHINFETLKIQDREQKEVNKTSKVIQDTINALMGLSVIEQKPNYFLIKDVSKTDKDSFDAILRRAFLLLLTISEESLNAIQQKDKEVLEEIPSIHHNIKQLTNYALRLLNKHEYPDHKKTANMYSVINNISEMSDSFRHIAKHYSKSHIKIAEEHTRLYFDLNKLVRQMYELFFDFKEEKLQSFFDQRDKVYVDYRAIKDKNKMDGVLENIGYIRQMTTNLIKERMVMRRWE